MRVKIHSLRGAPQYNETLGSIDEWDVKKERWVVKMDFDGTKNRLKEKNMIPWTDKEKEADADAEEVIISEVDVELEGDAHANK